MGRLVSAGSVIYSQVDFYQSANSINRLSGLTIASLSSLSFVNGANLNWPLTDGSLISDSSVSSGNLYFNEISSTGNYLVRFFADRVGFWRISIIYSGLQVERILEFDVIAAGALKPGSAGGLVASFIK